MRYISTTFHTNLLFGVIAALFFSTNLFAQIDNPLTDHVPMEYIKYIQSYQSDASDAVITDGSGYDNFNLGTAFAEPHLVQNPNNPLQYFTSFNTNTAYRTNDAFNWLISNPSFGASTYGDPVNAYDSLGNLFYENMSGSGTIQNCRVIRSTDNGTTWGTSVIAVLGNDKNWIAADQTSGPYANYLYTVMTNSGSGSFYRSTNNGASFTSTTSFATQSLPGMMVAVGPNGDVQGGCVYVVTNSGSSFASTYTFYASTNGGATFSLKSAQNYSGYVGTNVSGRNSVQNMRTRPYPFITADNSYGPNRGRLYLVYASNTPAGDGNKPDIFCRYSDDQAATWSSAVVINDDANTTAHNQWHPSIWCDKTSGRLFVKWMDTRDTPTSDSAHIYASYSDDGGLTWAENQRITTAKMRINCSTCGGGGTPRYQGDYDAITAIDNQSLMVWTDFRAGTFGSYVGFFPDYAMQVSPAVDTIGNEQDSVFYNVSVPSVKLYNSNVIFSASVSPTPANGTITVDFPAGNTLSTFPGNVAMRVRTAGNVSVGNYTITITGNGPNGTPVHKRTVTLNIGLIIPVELTAFSATVNKNDVRLDWTTATELNNLGFEIQRKDKEGNFESLGFINGKGTTTETNEYSFVDIKVDAGNYTYRLMQKDYDGTFAYSQEVEVEISLPLEYSLEQNYPNPFNPTTTISYSIPSDNFVTIRLYDVLGNEVITLVNEQKQAGKYEMLFNASNIASGVYYYQINSGTFTQTRKLMLLK
ncbi:MAG: T9SS type A sorting domain-containing protein [Ignavibacteriaceae bacterium]|mgnify:CR=1 FL=1|nr:T9SS type A sorting domain-containing protein [Ignavibacterium sp.]MCC6254526.1 T9SS type A sorting domain-containing protein [Ignavibacteriaceae bacterium]HRN25494.1 T9SS type A sorting domain-containing protein [Ignavibacteriaceae bacterium]HRQ53538.1 T9SS type A sorting domain-containing protein [Ignavibacteriaceae bacterium]